MFSGCGSKNESTTSSAKSSAPARTTPSTAADRTDASDEPTTTADTDSTEKPTTTKAEQETGGSGSGGGGAFVLIKIEDQPKDLELKFTPSDGTCEIDAAAGTASADVSIDDKSFTMSYDESAKADAKLEYKDSVTYAAQNVALYADADTPGSSVGSLTLSDKRAKGSVTFSDTTLTFVADFEIVCP